MAGMFDDLVERYGQAQPARPPDPMQPRPQPQPLYSRQRPISFDDLLPSAEQRMQGGVGPLVPSQTPDQFNVFPMRKTGPNPGQWEWDATAGVFGNLLRATTAPGDVARGTLQTPYSGGGPRPDADLASRAMDFAGLAATPSPSYRAGVRYGVAPGGIEPPSAGSLRRVGGEQLNAVGTSGYEIPSSALGDASRSVRQDIAPRFLEPGQAGPGAAPLTYGNLDRMTNPKYSSTSIAELKGYYDSLSGVIAGGGKDAVAAGIARDKISDMMHNLQNYGGRAQPGVTPTMTMEEVGKTFDAGTGNWRAGSSANRITGELNPATKGILRELDAKQNVAGVSFNMDRQLRARAEKMLADNATVASLLPDEQKLLEGVRDGTLTRNALRNFGEVFGISNPLRAGTSAAVGGALGGGAGAMGGASALGGGLLGGGIGAVALPAAGTVARMAGSGLTRKAIMAAEKLIRSNAPLAAAERAAAPIVSPVPIGRDALMQQVYRGILAPALEGERDEAGLPRGRRLLPQGYGGVI